MNDMHMKFNINCLSVIQLFFLWISVLISHSNCVDPVTTTAAITAVAASFGYASWNFFYCGYNECCDKNNINFDVHDIKEEMRQNLYGQHLVEYVVFKAVKAHLEKKQPNKALVMSFHGDTGSGKNHVSKMIAKHMYKKGLDSKYFHLYIGPKDFPHEAETKQYRDALREKIEKESKLCERSLFIFDEVDKIPPGVLDALTPYLDYHEKIDGVDYRKNIFIFLSNAGATNITQVALEFWANGKDREKITLKDVEPLITKGAFNEIGGFHHSEIVKRELIDVYVPFLPLEKKHVKQCIASELRNQNSNADIDMIADLLEYYPPTVELFSKYGCKKVSNKVDIFKSL